MANQERPFIMAMMKTLTIKEFEHRNSYSVIHQRLHFNLGLERQLDLVMLALMKLFYVEASTTDLLIFLRS